MILFSPYLLREVISWSRDMYILKRVTRGHSANVEKIFENRNYVTFLPIVSDFSDPNT